MRIEKTDIIHSLYNATNVGWDEINNKWLASDANGNTIDVVEADVDAEYAKQNYKNQRMIEYPSIEDQLDLMYHSGFDAWKAKIKETKEEIVNIYHEPKSFITPEKAGRWAVIQLVKAALGIPVLPGR